LGNDIDRAKINENLLQFLAQATIYDCQWLSFNNSRVCITFIYLYNHFDVHFFGENLAEKELNHVIEACEMVCIFFDFDLFYLLP
jgi:hypothetical protein